MGTGPDDEASAGGGKQRPPPGESEPVGHNNGRAADGDQADYRTRVSPPGGIRERAGGVAAHGPIRQRTTKR